MDEAKLSEFLLISLLHTKNRKSVMIDLCSCHWEGSGIGGF